MNIQNPINCFDCLPNEYIKMIEEVKKTKFPKIYDIFKFHFFRSESSTKEKEFKKSLLTILKNENFITYQIQQDQKNEFNNSEIKNSSNQEYNAIICLEKNCIIIESIKLDLIQSILSIKKFSSIDVNCDSKEINEEIKSFYNEFNIEIENNKFVKHSYKPIIEYIIHRNFFPSKYFKDQSFFNFDNYLIKKKEENEKRLHKSQLIEFKESDFIKLRIINSSECKMIILAIHIESFCLVALNEIYFSETKIIERQINFFENYSHRCMMKCYGFIQNNQYYIFVNEFMSNESLDSYMKNHKNEIDFFYSFMVMNRIFQSIQYIHSNNLIHRDIKPLNIFVNNDGLPFLSDFDKIRSIDEKSIDVTKMTLNFASFLYSSPEQTGLYDDKYDDKEDRKITYSTDIYSFGQLIYFIFEKKNMFEEINQQSIIQKIKNNYIPQFQNTPEIIQTLILKCIKYMPKDRPNIEEIKFSIVEQINSHFYFEPNFLIKLVDNLNKDFINFFLKENIVLLSQKPDMSQNEKRLENLFTALIKDNDIPSFMHSIGEKYKEGYFGQAEYKKAIEIFKVSSKLGNSSSFLSLGILHRDGAGVERDYKKAREYYEKSAQMKNSFGYILIGNLYFHAQGVEKSYEKVKEYYEKAANMGNSEALNGLAFLYLRGNGVQKDVQKALEYFGRSAKLDNPLALIHLGNIYLRGIVVEQDLKKTKKCYERAAELGYSEGLTGLGALYMRGLGVEKDFNKARELFEKGAFELNNSNAYLRLGVIYNLGYGVKRDYVKAKEYFETSYNKGNVEALIHLGILYLNGFGVEQNFEKTIEYFELAVSKNSSEALCALGFLHLMGLGFKKDYKKAREFFEKSAEKNNLDAYIYIANLYMYGQGVDSNWTIAKEYYEKSFQNRNLNGLYYLGKIYYYDYPKDYNKALEYFKKSTKDHSSNANIYIGHCYLNGYGVEKDAFKAIEYYELAAQAVNLKAFNALGKLYLKGADKVEKDYQKARKYFEQSSDGNDSDAFYYLGKIYYKGLGVDKSFKKAREYFESSAKFFNKRCLFYLGRIFEYGEGVDIDLYKAIEYYRECAQNRDEIFISYGPGGWNEEVRKNSYYYCSNNDLGLIYITENIFQDKKYQSEAEEYLKEAGLNEYPFGQNSFGVFCEFYLKQNDKAVHMFENASKEHFALAEFNLGRLKENEQNFEESIKHYYKAIQYENYPLIFHNHSYLDDRLEVSKSFVVCYTNLKFCLLYLSQNNFELSRIFFINALFKPIFKFLFNDDFQSYSFEIKINQNQDKSLTVKFRDFFINFPMFNNMNQMDQNNHNKSIWKFIDNDNIPNAKSKTIMLHFGTQKNIEMTKKFENEIINNDDDEIKDKAKKDKEINDEIIKSSADFDRTKIIEELNNIFNYYNTEKKFKRINVNQRNDLIEFIFAKIEDNNERKLKFPIFLFDYISKYIKTMKNEIKSIIDEMSYILFTPPYSVLFGRIKNRKSEMCLVKTIENIDKEFYDGFEMNE